MHNALIKNWLLATRPRTLPAAVAPVTVGIALAWADGAFAVAPALAALWVGVLLQIAVNLANDYFDYRKGIDTPDRLGPMRVTQAGLIPPGQVKAGMVMAFTMALMAGIYLTWLAGWPVLLLGLAAMAAALAYSGGPYPLASHGLGDVAVFIFFGPVAVGGTYYVQVLNLPWQVLAASVPVGLLITAILVVNNLRDIDTDRRAGKRSLAVRLGTRGSRIEYGLLLVSAYLFTLWLVLGENMTDWILLSLLSLPMAFQRVKAIRTLNGRDLNRLLAQTALLALVYSLLMGTGLIMGGLV